MGGAHGVIDGAIEGRMSDARPTPPPDPAARREEEGRTMVQAYCVKDKMKVEMNNPVKITMKNGKPATQGICPKCGNKVFRIGA
jgi:Domain of unknown function (DUF5679)